MDNTFKVTVKARMYHGILHETMSRFSMTQALLAEYLGMSIGSVGKMLRMGYVPKFDTESGMLIKQKLEELTEMTVSELFPEHVYTKDFLKRDKTVQVTREVPTHLLSNASQIYQLTLPPDEEIMTHEQEEGLKVALSTLTEREVKVLYERFVNKMTRGQIGVKFRVTRSRIQQIEAKALRCLRSPIRIQLLTGEIDNNNPLFKTWFKNLSEYRTTHRIR